MTPRYLEDLATKYAEENNSSFTNDYYGFLAGYRAKENEIQQVIDKLENSNVAERSKPIIKVLKSLMNESI